MTTTPPPDGSPPDASTFDVTNTDAPPTDTELEAFCKGTLGLYAPSYAECCDPSAAPKRYAFDKTLLEGLLLSCTMSLGKSVQSGRATFVPAAAATCTTNVSGAMQARTCPEVLHTPSNQPSKSIFKEAAGCSEVLVGRQALDASCANDYECLDGLTCVGWTTTSDGTCKTPPGDSALCGYAIPDGGGFLELVRWGFGTHPRCAAGFYCASTALQQGTCRPSKPADGSCNSHDECADGLRCQLGVCGTAGPAPADAPCKRNSDCQDRLFCKSADGGSLCASPEVAGTPCSNELGSECQGACVKPDGGGPASCVAYCGSQ
ncbi:MAG TPA: Dickkopf N-terminal cysteine-rich domain-containing protein [Labilithrix sp.]|nr:Dickkopf N-terminal cysteine-rich domain-containing protein [Labilithrix sp.]